MDFTYSEYKDLLQKLRRFDYRPSDFFEQPLNTHTVLLRHDIDIDLMGCVEMAICEEEVGYYSTWFIQINADFYNPFSKRALQIFERLGEKHCLGMHVDPLFYGENEEELLEKMDRTYKFMSNYIPISKVFSFHRPAKFVKNTSLSIKGFVNAYDVRFLKEMAYVSDSNRREFLDGADIWNAMEKQKNIQLLTHPIWWNNERMDLKQVLKKIEGRSVENSHYSLSNNIKQFGFLNQGE